MSKGSNQNSHKKRDHAQGEFFFLKIGTHLFIADLIMPQVHRQIRNPATALRILAAGRAIHQRKPVTSQINHVS